MGIKKEKSIKANKKAASDCRQQILDVALEMFAQKGYAATTIREMVDAVGIKAPSLYYYFGSKEGLYMELIKTHSDRIDEVIESYETKATRARDRLKDLIDKFFLQVMNDKYFFRLMFSIYYGPSQGAPDYDFIAFHVKFHKAIKKLIIKGIAAGEFLPGNPGTMTRIIRGVVQLAMEEQIKDDREKMDRKGLQRILDLILDRFERKQAASEA
jgi:TetR/AcrR family transcriptional regulator